MTGRFGRTLGIIAALAGVWVTWWVWPPQPDWQFEIAGLVKESFGRIARDGRSYVWAGKRTNATESATSEHQLVIVGLTEGVPLRAISVNEDTDFDCNCPLGNRLVYREPGGNFHLLDLPSGNVIKADIGANLEAHREFRVAWSPDGNTLLLRHSDGYSLFRSDNGARLKDLPTLDSDYQFLDDSSGIITSSHDGRMISIVPFDPNKAPDIIQMPAPTPYSGETAVAATASRVVLTGYSANADGSNIVAFLQRFRGESDSAFEMSLARWNRDLRQWRETPFPFEPNYPPVCPQLTKDGRFMTYSVNTRRAEHISRNVRATKRNLYDLAGDVPRCCNEGGFPQGVVFFHPAGGPIWVASESNGGLTFDFFDPTSLKLLRSIHRRNGPEFGPSRVTMDGPDGDWLTLRCQTPSLMVRCPQVLRGLVEHILPFSYPSIDVIHLTDGSMTRRIPRDEWTDITNDGSLWIMSLTDSQCGSFSKRLERWRLESPPPWWLWAVTCLAVIFALKNHV